MSILKRIKAFFTPKQTEQERRFEAAKQRQLERQNRRLNSDALDFTESGHFFKPDFMQKRIIKVEQKNERIKLLIEALRSKKYIQIRHKLGWVDGKCFCALGLACEIYRQQTGLGSWSDDTFILSGKHSHNCPVAVLRWFGERNFINLPYDLTGAAPLSYLNDHYCTFSQLADILEKQCLFPSPTLTE